MTMPHANALFFIVLSNVLPLLGVVFAGWDIFTLLIFYWCETVIIGFWTVMTIAFFRGQKTWSTDGLVDRNGPLAAGGATIIALHAGFFMAVHLFLMSVLYGGEWQGHLRSPLAFIDTFQIGQNLWPMLLMVFLHRGAIFLEERNDYSVMPAVAGLYLRIVVMQFVVIFGAWGVMLLGSGMFGLIILVVGRAVLDFKWPEMIAYASKMAGISDAK